MAEINEPERRHSEALSGSALARKRVLRIFSDPAYVVRAARYTLGLPTPLRTEDRRVLEQVIFPAYATRDDIHTVLFVGCQWYTRHYEKTYFPRQTFWTIDPLRDARRYGASHHVVAPLERLADFFPESTFDLIICNGVYGWGLDSRAQCEAAFAQCHSRLRPGGHFVLGWNDTPALTPMPLESIASLKLFRRADFPEFGTWRFVTQTKLRHVFDFYCK
ncbi:MAG TPA: methyltransferase domain-containing protein [Stellaceae bacterium]|nr:methyltransferase domain-containing protein [Stellaceae bacterium]